MSLQRRMSRREMLTWLAALAVIILPVAGLTAHHIVQTTQADARSVGLPIPVQTVTAIVQSVDEVVGGSGIVQSSEPVNVSAKVAARVAKVPFEVGAVVRPGDLLVEFDPELYSTNYESERLSYQHFQKELLRTELLVMKHFSSPVDLENAQIAEARARVAM